jgi:CheY-like chemotaxis protein
MAVVSKRKKTPLACLGRLRAAPPTRVLVVDDEAFMLSLVSRMLEALGFEVGLAKGGLEAIEYLSRSRYRLVITDLQMPDMNGHALAGWIKHHFHDVIVVIMTGNSPDNVVNYAETGIVDEWIFKPFNLNELKMKLSRFA